MYKLEVIPHRCLIQTWPYVEKLFSRIVKASPDEITLEGIQGRLLDKSEFLAVVMREGDPGPPIAAFTFGFATVDTGKKFLGVTTLAGHEAPEWLEEIVKQLVIIAQAENCYEVRALGCRRGWAKMVDKALLKGQPGTERYTLKFNIEGIRL